VSGVEYRGVGLEWLGLGLGGEFGVSQCWGWREGDVIGTSWMWICVCETVSGTGGLPSHDDSLDAGQFGEVVRGGGHGCWYPLMSGYGVGFVFCGFVLDDVGDLLWCFGDDVMRLDLGGSLPILLLHDC
jgi:hypothetical protein